MIGEFNLRDIDWTNTCTHVSEDHIATQFLECVRDTYFFPTCQRANKNTGRE